MVSEVSAGIQVCFRLYNEISSLRKTLCITAHLFSHFESPDRLILEGEFPKQRTKLKFQQVWESEKDKVDDCKQASR